MIRKSLNTFLVILGLLLGYHLIRFQFRLSLNSASETTFFIGLSTTLISLIVVSKATTVFSGITFVFKSFSKDFRDKYPKYYDYYEERNGEKGPSSYGYYYFVAGLVLIGISLILSQIILNNIP